MGTFVKIDLTGNATVIASKTNDFWQSGSLVVPLGMRATPNGTVFTNGKYGVELTFRHQICNQEHPVLVVAYQDFGGKKLQAATEIKDATLASRLLAYLENYYGEKRTNCSTLARYLYNGTFEECDLGRRGMMFNEHLTPYADQKICVGDVVCVLFYRKDRSTKSRLAPEIRQHYLNVRSSQELLVRNKLRSESLSPELMRKVCSAGFAGDYHFFTCIGECQGEKIYVGQSGLHMPGKTELYKTPILFSIGTKRPASEAKIFFTLIKRRK